MTELYHENQPATKVCHKCNPPTAKPLAAFSKNKNAPDGLRAWCKECSKVYNRQYYRNNHNRLLLMQRQYEQDHRAESLERVRQWRKDNPDGRVQEGKKYYATHKDYEAVRGKRYREQNIEKNRARGRKYYKENPEKFKPNYHRRRAMKLANGGIYTPQQWRDLCEHYQHTCLRCKQQEPHIKLTPDHIVPLSKGGSNDIMNIQPLCLTCNISKGDKTIDYREV